MQIIDELWGGNIIPTEHSGQNNPQIRKLLSLMVRNKEKLDKELPKSQKNVLSALTDTYDEYIFIGKRSLS